MRTGRDLSTGILQIFKILEIVFRQTKKAPDRSGAFFISNSRISKIQTIELCYFQLLQRRFLELFAGIIQINYQFFGIGFRRQVEHGVGHNAFANRA